MKHQVILNFEPADRSVGIMSEGFAGWEDNASCWCSISQYESTLDTSKFEWFDNESGDKIEAPNNHRFVERIVWEFANSFYEEMCED